MVAHPAGDHEQYLQLPPGEPVDFSRVPEHLRRGDYDDVLIGPGGAVCGGMNRRVQFLHGGALYQVGYGPEPDQLAHQPGVVVHSDYYHPGRRRVLEHAFHRLLRTHDRHLHVQEHDVGRELLDEGDGLPPVPHLTDNLYLLVGGEHLLYALAEHGVIVGQQHPYPAIRQPTLPRPEAEDGPVLPRRLQGKSTPQPYLSGAPRVPLWSGARGRPESRRSSAVFVISFAVCNLLSARTGSFFASAS